jgi:isopentenyl-diphosphate delta-isomerase
VKIPTGARETVVLVDTAGQPVGTAPKLAAHTAPGRLHLAVSVFLYRDDGALLIQQRAASKYHFPGVWANSCCSHPGPGEPIAAAAHARVLEELGVRVTLSGAGSFVYRASCPHSGLVEHEFDAVFIGTLHEPAEPDPKEVAALEFVTVEELGDRRFEGTLAPWFFPALDLAEAARRVPQEGLR